MTTGIKPDRQLPLIVRLIVGRLTTEGTITYVDTIGTDTCESEILTLTDVLQYGLWVDTIVTRYEGRIGREAVE